MESLIEKCTSEKNTQDNWDLILKVCEDYASKEPKACLKAICKRVFHKNPNVSLRAITLLDACSKNCGQPFNRELASRDFTQTLKKNFSTLQRLPALKFIEILEKWTEEFRNDSELALAASLYGWVKSEHIDLAKLASEEKNLTKSGRSRQNAAEIQAKEEEDLAQAIALSLKETNSKLPSQPTSTSKTRLYPDRAQIQASLTSTTALPPSAPKSTLNQSKGQVRALYDFEAVEDNELTFKAGELIVLLDDSDENWWLGSNHRGQGLFPAQFVKRETEDEKNVKSNITPKDTKETEHRSDQSDTPIIPQLDEQKIDTCLNLIKMVDPTGEYRPDPPELERLEAECLAMCPLVDPDLELVDKRILMLTELEQRLVDAFQLYHNIMSHQNASSTYYGGISTTDPTLMMMMNGGQNSYLSNTVNTYSYPLPGMPNSLGPSHLAESSVTAQPNSSGNIVVPSAGEIYPASGAGLYTNPQNLNYFTLPSQSGVTPDVSNLTSQPQQSMQSGYNGAAVGSVSTVASQALPSYSANMTYGYPTSYPMIPPSNQIYTDPKTLQTQQSELINNTTPNMATTNPYYYAYMNNPNSGTPTVNQSNTLNFSSTNTISQ